MTVITRYVKIIVAGVDKADSGTRRSSKTLFARRGSSVLGECSYRNADEGNTSFESVPGCFVKKLSQIELLYFGSKPKAKESGRLALRYLMCYPSSDYATTKTHFLNCARKSWEFAVYSSRMPLPECTCVVVLSCNLLMNLQLHSCIIGAREARHLLGCRFATVYARDCSMTLQQSTCRIHE